MLRAGFGEGVRSCCADSQPDAPHESPPVHQPESSLSPVLLGFYGGFIMHVWLTKLLAVEDRMPPLVPLPSPEAREWDWSSNPLISWLIFLATSPHAHLLSQCHLIHITKDTVIALTLISQEIPKVLAAPCQEQWMKSKYLSLIIKHSFPQAIRSIEVWGFWASSSSPTYKNVCLRITTTQKEAEPRMERSVRDRTAHPPRSSYTLSQCTHSQCVSFHAESSWSWILVTRSTKNLTNA